MNRLTVGPIPMQILGEHFRSKCFQIDFGMGRKDRVRETGAKAAVGMCKPCPRLHGIHSASAVPTATCTCSRTAQPEMGRGW